MRVEVTPAFEAWFERLRDRSARARVQVRIDRAAGGNLGDVRSVGQGVQEMKIDYGPGYRLYFVRRGERMIILLCGGDKASQQSDIVEAQRLSKEV